MTKSNEVAPQPALRAALEALAAIESQCIEMRSLKGWRWSLIRENLAKAKAALATAPVPHRDVRTANDPAETWGYIERLLQDECGLRTDEGLQGQRANCINAIKNGLPDAGLMAAAIEFLSNGEGLHKIRVNGEMMDRKTVARSLTIPAAPATASPPSPQETRRALEQFAPASPPSQPRNFYGAECTNYPSCSGGCGLGCTHEIETSLSTTAPVPPSRPALRAALEPFAKAWEAYGEKPSDDTKLSNNYDEAWLEGTLITFGDLKRAHAALATAPAPAEDEHPLYRATMAWSEDPLSKLVSRFAYRLLKKLRLAQANGRSGWERDDWEKECQQGLLNHVAKGDPRDVAAYCAFMDHHGWITAPAPAEDVRAAVIEECARAVETAGLWLNNGELAKILRALANNRGGKS